MAEVVEKASDFLYKTGNVVWAFSLDIVGQIFGLKKKPNDPGRSALEERTATVVSSDSPHRYIYGRCRVGSSVVAVLTSGVRDEYKHIVSVHAAHECDAIEEIYINGIALGTLDADGNVTTGIYSRTVTTNASQDFSGTSVVLANTPDTGSVRVSYFNGTSTVAVPYMLVGSTVTVAETGYTNNVVYTYSTFTSYVRVKKHLGIANDPADTSLITEVPTKWDINRKLVGMCYTVIRLNLNFQDFQSGMPEIEVLVRGKKLHDVRSVYYPSDTPIWSQNPALMIADYLTSEFCRIPWTDLPLADFITAANVCDESTVYGAKYLADGTVSSDDSQKDVLEDMALCMAGTIVATTWGVTAGKYVAPVMALSQSDVVGDFSYTAGVPEAELYNGVKGKYVSSLNLYVATDFAPYQNSAYVIADGQELWNDQDFNFTSSKQRVHNLSRIFTEDQRNGFTINADFSFKAWALQVGQRVTFTSSFIGQTDKVYRIVGKSFSATSAVKLTLKEDAAEIWDLADAVTEDATPNTDLPSPFTVAVPGNVQVSEDLYQTTGSSGVKVSATLSWDAPSDTGISEYEIQYKPYYSADFIGTTSTVNTSVVFFDFSEGYYDFRVRAKNRIDIYSDWVLVTLEIHGLSLVPSNVSGFTITPFNGSALARWDRTTDLDVKIGGDVEIRFCPLTTGATWEQSVILPDGNFNGDATNAIVSLATGTYFAKFKDSTGQYSTTSASFVANESLVTGWSTVATSTQHTAYTGTKTNVAAVDGILKLDSTSLIDDMGLIDSLGYIDGIGGISTSGTYEFDATMDLSTVATRRFHSHIKSLAYNANDFIDSRMDLIDTWQDIDGGVINGANASTYISVSDDDITYSSWVPFMVTDRSCRYAKFKTVLTTSDSTHNINVSELSVAAKVQV